MVVMVVVILHNYIDLVGVGDGAIDVPHICDPEAID
jgi:hypothetical protein